MVDSYRLYVISFTVGKESGIAVVAADDDKSAFQMLKNGGSRNGGDYSLVACRLIGETCCCRFGVLIESYVNALEAYAAIESAMRGVGAVQGEKGEKGDKGDRGDKGDTGAQGPRGIQGPQGERGLRGLQGPQGETGATPSISVGTVSTVPAGSQASATITGTSDYPILNLYIPKGDQGNTGSSVDYPYELVNNRTTNDATKGLSAAEGYRLGNDIAQNALAAKRQDSWQSLSRAPITFVSDTQISIGSGYIYFRKGGTLDYSAYHQAQTYTFSGSCYLCYNITNRTFAVQETPSVDDLVLFWHDGVAGFRAGLLYDEYVLSMFDTRDATKYDNFNAVSRAAITFPATGQVSIGSGDIYIRKGSLVVVTINHSSHTYTFLGSGMLCYNLVSHVLEVKSVPEDGDLVMLWYDGVSGFRAGLLITEYILSKISSGSDGRNYDNFNAVSRAAVTFPSVNSVSIGSGNIYIRKGNTVVKTISHTSHTYTFSGSGMLCYNLSTSALATKTGDEMSDNDIILLWYDGSEGFRAGLLYGEFLLANAGGGGGGGTSGSVDNLNAVSRAPISFPENNKVRIGTGYIYLRKGNTISYTISHVDATYTFTGSSMLCYNTSARTVSIKSSPDENDVVLLWYDGGVVDFRAGLLYDEYLRLKADSGYPPMEYVLPSSAHPDDALQPMVHGATNSYPQNCATLYKLASKYRINFWENDVRPCLDGYVLAHNDDMSGYALDANGDTIPANTWLCSQKTVAQLKTLKVGIKPNTSTLVSGYENEKILTFEEYIILAKAYNAVPVVELKFGATQAQVTELYAVCAKHGMDERVIWNCYGARFQHATYIQGINPDAYILFTFNPSDETDTMKSLLDTCATYINNRNQVMVSLPWDDWDETTNGVTFLEYAQSLGLRAATWPESNTTFVAQAKAGVCNMCTNMYYGLEDNVIYYLQKHNSELVG